MKKVSPLFLILLLCPVFVLAADKVEINTASLQQLDELTGIGPALAQRITDARPFSSVDDLLRVKGIGEKTLQKMKDQGLAYVEELAQQTNILAPAQAPPTEQSQVPNTVNTASDTRNLTPIITYPLGIFINEVLPSPEGTDEIEEWIEIFNKNNSEANLSGWQIEDTAGKTTTYTFPSGTKVSGQGYLVLRRPNTRITLNNDGDGLILSQPTGALVDSVDFGKAPFGQSYSRSEAGWAWSAILTPNGANIFPLLEEKTGGRPLSAQGNSKKAGNGSLPANDDNFRTAAVGEKIPINQNRSFPLLIAIAISAASAGLIFILKKFLASRLNS